MTQSDEDDAVNYFLSLSEQESNIMMEIEGTKFSIIDGKGRNKTFDLKDIMKIDQDDLSAEFATQAAVYAYFATLVAAAERNVSVIELKKNQEYASADEAYRKDYEKRDKKYTEAVIKSAILLDDDYDKISKELADAEYQLSLLKAITKALEQRANMLVSLGARERFEYNMTAMHINERSEDAVNTVKDVIRKKKQSRE